MNSRCAIRLLPFLLGTQLLAGCNSSSNSSNNTLPVFTSSNAINLQEGNTNTGYTAAATDAEADSLSFQLMGDDAELFSLDSDTGVLLFNSAADFENPSDANSDNIYSLIISVSDESEELVQQVLNVTVTDKASLALTVHFPSDNALVDDSATSVTFNGQITDSEDGVVSEADVASLSLNDQAITLNADSSWSLQALVEQHENTYTFNLEDLNGEVTSHTQTLYQNTIMKGGYDIELDLAGGKVYVSDGELKALLVGDLSTGQFQRVSDATHGTGTALDFTRGLALDKTNNAVYIADFIEANIIKVDLATGNREIFSNSTTGTGDDLISPKEIEIDEENNRLIVADGGAKAIFSVDLATGNRSIISRSGTQGSGDDFSSLTDIVLDVENDVMYCSEDGRGDVMAVELSTGNRTILSTGLSSPHNITMDKPNNTLYVGSTGSDSITAIDAATGDQTLISDNSKGLGLTLNSLGGIAFDETNQRLIMSEFLADTIMFIDIQSGDRTLLEYGLPGEGDHFSSPWDLAFDAATNAAFIIQDDDVELDGIIKIDLSNGDRSIISSATTGTGTNFDNTLMFDVNVENNLAIVTDEDLRAVFSVELTTGNRTILSDDTTGEGQNFEGSYDAVIDYDNNRAFIADAGIYSVDLTSGDRTLISADGNGFDFVTAMMHDTDNNRLLAIDDEYQAVVAVDIESGVRTVISSEEVGSGDEFSNPIAFAYDKDNNRLLLSDNSAPSIMAIDLTNGNRSVLSSNEVGNGVFMESLAGIAFNKDKNIIYAVLQDSLLAVDVVSGDRVIVSK